MRIIFLFGLIPYKYVSTEKNLNTFVWGVREFIFRFKGVLTSEKGLGTTVL
jgi:hypothetical protein